MIIDSHLHVWSDDAGRYPWAGEGTTEAGSVELLLETMARHGVDKACIVQPIHYLFDNRYVADCLARYRTTFSGIAIMDRRAPDAVEQLERLVGGDGFEGFAHASGPGRRPGGVGGARPGSDLAQGRGTRNLHAELRPGRKEVSRTKRT